MLDFYAFMVPRDGYGEGSIAIAHALTSLRNDVRVVDLRQGNIKHPWGNWGKGLIEPETFKSDCPAIMLALPAWLPAFRAAPLYNHTMFEATKVPSEWIDAINRHAHALIVPCAWNIEVYRACGVKVPIYLARWGVDAKVWSYIDRRRHSLPFTFLWTGTPDMRKGWDLVYTAFDRVFRGNMDVRLILHFRIKPKGVRGFRDPNVQMIHGYLGELGLRALYASADAFVFPSRGEGFGLPPRQAAATGLPVLATNWGGLADGIEHWATPLAIAGMSRAEFGFFDDIGEWAEPNRDDIAAWMEYSLQNRDGALAQGREASAWLHLNATWEQTAARLLEITEERNQHEHESQIHWTKSGA